VAKKVAQLRAVSRHARRTPQPRSVRVLFIHPSFPNQFTALAAELHKAPGFSCFGMVHAGWGPTVVAAAAPFPHFGFLPDGQSTAWTYPYAATFEDGMRNGRGVVSTLLAMHAANQFNVIIGHAAFGVTLYLKSLLPCAVISYVELPGYQTVAARPEFPITMDVVLASRAYEGLLYASILNSDLCIVPSEHAKQLLPSELQSKARVQMEGFDADAAPTGGPAERAALGLPVHTPVVGFFGRTLEAVRGFDIFVEVAKRLRARHPTVQFLVIGDEQTLYGNEKTYLGGQTFKAYALARAGVPENFFHWLPTMPYTTFRRYIACLDLAILPIFEGAANWSLFEAMAAGLPIVSSTRGYVPEAIRQEQEGVLLDPYDIEGFVECALMLLQDTDRARRLGQAAKMRIRQHYSIAHAAAGYRRIIEEALTRARVPSLILAGAAQAAQGATR